MMKEIVVARDSSQIEGARVLINRICPLHQYILRQDRELIPSNRSAEILTGKNKELILTLDQGVVVGTVVLGIMPKGAWFSHLVRDPASSKGTGEEMIRFIEQRAKEVHKCKNIQLSVVRHPQCEQAQLQNFYKKQGYSLFDETAPLPEHLEDWDTKWNPKEVVFKWFKKDL